MGTNRSTSDWRSRLCDVLIALCALLSGGVAVSTQVTVESPVTPEADRNGWIPLPPDAADEHLIEVFALAGPVESSEGAVVKLWQFAKAINGGRHFPTLRQEVGDCVAHGVAQALRYGQAADIYYGRVPATEFRDVDRPYIYGVSRVEPDLGNKKLGRSDGSVGRWAALAVQKYGVLPADAPGVPEYSGARSRDWGYNGVPEATKWQAALHRVQQVAQVKSYEDVRDALANGYPVTVAGNLGFNDTKTVEGGKRWGRRSGSWSHQMCLIAVDDTARSPFSGQVGACYCLNSWGEQAHGLPADDAPPGGFWIDRAAVDAYCQQGDCWALSQFEGFPQRRIDEFVLFDPPAADVELEPEAVPLVPACEHYAGVSTQAASQCGIGGVSLCGLTLAYRLRRRIRRQMRNQQNALSA